MNEEEFAELSAGHALGALSPEDERAYADALAAHPEWAAIVDVDAETVVVLAEGVADVAPPVDMRSRLLSRIARESAAPAADPTTAAAGATEDAPAVPPLPEVPASIAADAPPAPSAGPPTEVVQAIERRTWTRGLFGLVASIVLLVGLGWGAGALANLWADPPAVQALEEIEQAPDAESATAELADGGEATVHWSESLGKVVLVADGLPEIPSDRTFELWFVRGEEAISAGTFDASGAESTTLLTGAVEPGDTIAITVEQAGGSPDGDPTTDPIVAIPTA